MAKLNEKWLQGVVEGLLPREWLQEKAREVGAVKRERKVDIGIFVWTVVLGFAVASRERTIASIRRAYEQASGQMMAPSSFYYRFTKELVKLLSACVEKLIAEAGKPQTKMKGILKRFTDLVMTDSTVVRLNALLAKKFPGTRTNHSPAALKLHVVISALAHGARSIKWTSGRTADGPVFKVGKWIEGRLLLFDLGYYSFQLFDRIAKLGGFFVSRAKDGFNPIVLGDNLSSGRRRVKWGATRFQDILHRFKGEFIDLRVCVKFKRRAYRGRQASDQAEFRLVGIWNPETKRHHLYLTNILPEQLTPQEVAQAYSARWEIELLFKELKGAYHLEDLNTENEWIVRSLILATLITGIIARTLQAAIARALPSNKRIPRRRFAAVFSTVATRLLDLIASTYADLPSPVERLVEFLLHESKDPNVSRSSLLCGIAL